MPANYRAMKGFSFLRLLLRRLISMKKNDQLHDFLSSQVYLVHCQHLLIEDSSIISSVSLLEIE